MPLTDFEFALIDELLWPISDVPVDWWYAKALKRVQACDLFRDRDAEAVLEEWLALDLEWAVKS